MRVRQKFDVESLKMIQDLKYLGEFVMEYCIFFLNLLWFIIKVIINLHFNTQPYIIFTTRNRKSQTCLANNQGIRFFSNEVSYLTTNENNYNLYNKELSYRYR